MISHLSIVYMRGASRQYGSTLNPPTFEPLPLSCGKYERGKGKKFGPPPRLAEIVERGGEQRKRILSCFAPSSSPPTFFPELLTPEPPDQQAEGEPGGNSLKFKSPNPLFFFFLFEWQLRHGKGGGGERGPEAEPYYHFWQ